MVITEFPSSFANGWILPGGPTPVLVISSGFAGRARLLGRESARSGTGCCGDAVSGPDGDRTVVATSGSRLRADSIPRDILPPVHRTPRAVIKPP